MPTKVRYDGPFDEVEVPAAGVVAKRGEVYELESEVAKSLLEQEDSWSRPDFSKPVKVREARELAPELSGGDDK